MRPPVSRLDSSGGHGGGQFFRLRRGGGVYLIAANPISRNTAIGISVEKFDLH